MEFGRKQKILAAVLAAVLLLSVGIYGVVDHMYVSADEERSQMSAIVSQYTEDTGFMDADYYELTDSQGEAIDKAAEESMMGEVQTPGGETGQPGMSDPGTQTPEDPGAQTPEDPGTQTPEDPGTQVPEQPSEPHTSVNVRDWRQYRSTYSYDRMTGAEQSLWTRIESVADAYMNSSELDATYSASTGLYTTYSIRYGDLELTRSRAIDLAQWFLFCNPQYWYMRPTIMSTSTSIYIGIYDIGIDGDDRANVTNQLFSEVDRWAASAVGATTSYQKVRAVHDRIRDELTYQNGAYDQCVYSAFVQKQAVCAGYAGSTAMVLNSLGVETVTIASGSHAWNAVRMEDGTWYGLDTTWDDSLGSDQFFLVSDEALRLLDNQKESHIPVAYAENWIPPVSGTNYAASSYDNSGSNQPAVSVGTPSNLRVEYVDDATGRFMWDAVSGAEGYEVQIYRDSVLNGSTSLTGQAVKLNGLRSGSPVTLKVRAYVKSNGYMTYSEWASVDYSHDVPEQSQPAPTPAATVAVPTNLRVLESTESYVRIGWDPVTGSDVSYEIVGYKDANLTSQRAHATVTSTAARLSGMQDGMTLYVQVRAVRNVDGVECHSDWATVTATARLQQVSAPAPVLGEPSNLTWTPKTDTSIRLSWNSVPNAYQYGLEIYRDAAHTDKVTTASVKATSCSLSSLKQGNTYYMRVKAYGTVDGVNLESGYSDITVTMSGAAAKATLDKPGAIGASKTSSSTYRVTWGSVSGASKYEFQISYVSDFSKIASTTSLSGTSAKLSNVGTRSYYLRVRAIGTVDGTEVQSEWTTATLKK